MSMFAQAFKKVWGQADEDEEDYDLSEAPEPAAPSKYSSDKYSSDKYGSDKNPTEKYSSDFGGGSGSGNRARSLRTVPIPLRAREKNIYTLRPKNQDEAAIAADYLKSGSAVVMNLETVDKPVAMRIIDFMSGVCYGLEGQGHAMKLGDSIFLFTPAEFEISSDELDYGENRDFFFKDPDKSTAPQPMPQRASAPSSAAVIGQSSGSVLLPPAQSTPSGNVSPSGYATADYSSPHAPSSVSASSGLSMSAQKSVQASTLPASSVYSSSGKAHVLVGGQPASITPSISSSSSNTSPQSSYQSSERRSWER